MTDTYYRDRALRAEADAENARARRMETLDEALADVLYQDALVIDGADRETLARGRQIVQELRKIW